MKVGDVVEWNPLYAPGTMRGRVTRIEPSGRVYLAIERARKPKKPAPDVWFEPSEVRRLRVVTP